MIFANRREAGRVLAAKLIQHKCEHPVVLALPRGGLPVAYEVAKALEAPLDIILVRKLGVPFQPELAMGAVVDGDDPQTVLNQEIMDALQISEEELGSIVTRELAEIARRQDVYRQGRPPVNTEGATIIVVDDGIATGASVRAALRGIRRRPLGKLVLAVPVAPASTLRVLMPEVDELVCLYAPEDFGAVGYYYKDFSQVEDDEVVRLLAEAQTWAPQSAATRSQ